jgi:histidyl-tRNA synthetase
MKAASKSGARFAVIVGADESASGTATVRDLDAGEQTTVPLAELVASLKIPTSPGDLR